MHSLKKTAQHEEWLLPGTAQDRQTVARDQRKPEAQNIDGAFFRRFHPVRTSYGNLNEMLRSEWLGENRAVDQIFVATQMPGWISAWHAHADITDRLFVALGRVRVVLYDSRSTSPTCGNIFEQIISGDEPGLLIVPPRVWHGTQNIGGTTACVINAPDIGYCYETPDHWRLPADTAEIPYRFER